MSADIDMSRKNPTCKHNTVCCTFSELFTLNGAFPQLACVSAFKYLGHMISNSLFDNDNVQREIRCLFVS